MNNSHNYSFLVVDESDNIEQHIAFEKKSPKLSENMNLDATNNQFQLPNTLKKTMTPEI